MSANSKIEWCDNTFNPWWGCTKIAAGCAHCYAETFSRRVGRSGLWGTGQFRFFGDAHWAEPLKWDRQARQAGRKAFVFCGSMCDWLHDEEAVFTTRLRLVELVEKTPNLVWLLLTKRISDAARLVPQWSHRWPSNAWAGYSASTQADLDAGASDLLACPAPVRFLSVEPMLKRMDFRPFIGGSDGEARVDGSGHTSCVRCGCAFEEDDGARHECPPGFGGRIHQIIFGCESGPHRMPCDPDWIRDGLRQCRDSGVAAFVKQIDLGGRLSHDPQEWPADLRLRQRPDAAAMAVRP